MSDETTEHELSQDEIDDSLSEQGFSAEVGTERWVSDLESQFASDDEVVEPDVAVGGDDLPAAEGDAPGGDFTDYIQLGDVKVPQEEAERVAKFWDWMNTNPDEAMKFVGYMTGEYQLIPQGQQAPTQQQPQQQPQQQQQYQAPAEDLYEDWDLLPDSVQERLKKVDQLEGYLAQQHQTQQQAIAHQNQKHVETAQAQFGTAYDLSNAEVHRMATEAARLNIVPALLQETGDPIKAVERALEIVYLQSEDGREREFNKRIAASESDAARKRKMASVGGSAGSVSRQDSDSVPGDAAGRRSAMVNEIAAALGNRTD
jgi:hypothetical protein